MNNVKVQEKNTIYALSTCYGKSGIAVIRISGPNSLKALKDFHFTLPLLPKVATLGKIYNNRLEMIDEVIILHFPKNNSYTGQDVIELQTHGGIAVINAILSKLNFLNYLRLANNGEFTRIALENNRISLTKAESLIDLINSETEYQRKIAIRHYNGTLETVYLNWRKRIINLLSVSEAFIDFPENILTSKELKKLHQKIKSLQSELNRNIESFSQVNTLMNGIYISIVGATNVGKSTLMNAISKADTSIVSNIKGTTRDVVKTKIEMLGVPIIMQDTAGIRVTSNKIENIGIEKSKKVIKNSDIVIIILDALDLPNLSIFLDIKEFINIGTPILILLNKIDKIPDYEKIKSYISYIIKYLQNINFIYNNLIPISLKLEKYHLQIIKLIKSLIKDFLPTNSAHLITNIRHQNNLKNCVYYLQKASKNNNLELIAEELRFAAKELGALLGGISTEEILDEIFSSFCIGK